MTTERPHAASIKDVAALAKVSIGTVSNVLNRPGVVAASTRDRVEQAISDLHFVRNESARQLRIGSSSTLAYLMLDAANPFFSDVARGMEERAESASLMLMTCNSSQRAERQQSHLAVLEQQRVRGILITPIDPTEIGLNALSERGTPVVIVDRARDDYSLCSVSVNDVLGGRTAIQHLLELGHHRVGFVGGPPSLGQVADRFAGALAAWTAAGHQSADLTWHETSSLNFASGRSAGDLILSGKAEKRPSALFAANDLVAMGLLQAATNLNVAVPGELAIIGYDDIEFAAAASVPLSSVSQPRLKIGQTAAELLIDEVGNSAHRHQRVVFDPELVVRRSTVA